MDFVAIIEHYLEIILAQALEHCEEVEVFPETGFSGGVFCVLPPEYADRPAAYLVPVFLRTIVHNGFVGEGFRCFKSGSSYQLFFDIKNVSPQLMYARP